MGQRQHISADCITRVWNKVIHCISFKIMLVWAKDQETRQLMKKKAFTIHISLAVYLIEYSLNPLLLNPKEYIYIYMYTHVYALLAVEMKDVLFSEKDFILQGSKH